MKSDENILFIRFHQISPNVYISGKINFSLNWLVSPGPPAGISALVDPICTAFLAMGKPMKRPALAKGSPKQPLKKGILKRHNLKKLGEMNLKEKVLQVTKEHDDENVAAAELQKQLTPAEKSRAWGKRQTHLCQKGNEEEKNL